MTTTNRKNEQASVSASPTSRRGRPPEPGGPVPDRERSARYRARKQELEDRVSFTALISAETMRQISEMCKSKGKRRGELLEKIVAQAYGRFMKGSAWKA